MATLKEILSTKTDDQLRYYLDHVDKHTSEGVRTALAELKNRNAELPEGIDEQIEEKIRLKETTKYDSLQGWKRNVVQDIDAPEYYSQTAIYVFSILFSVLFGAVMMAINLKNAGKRWGMPILFGLIFTLGFIFLSEFIPNRSSGITLIVNVLGVVIMYQLFWNKNIGKDTKYRAKPIWIPLIIAIILVIPLVYFAVQN
ncbi:hypothetical protein OC25_24620 [Pedobacter kyungheensis]|uniref:Uncharacterized protein n=1 Tax=Pedobacter kyungheensis TaxID=1069985 RepID=A0A0C1FR02_9SPHI|nr:hypothetical protein [Pedobacter kyungheensis]KIA90309.1 hypothetical protein OC25_24620 [Pedobacter kyungheensis]